MKTRLLTVFLLFATFNTYARLSDQADTLHIDLDKDLVNDIVIFDKENGIIICKLSTQQFKAIKSREFNYEENNAGIRATKSGFEFHNNYMRAGYACQFRYNQITKQIQLIGMSRYEFGPANNDGSGESSVNLLIHNYIGHWNYYDERKSELIAIPTIKQKMILPTTYLQNFSDAIFFKYQDLCVDIFEMYNAKMRIQNNTNTYKKIFTNEVGKNTLQVKIYNPCIGENPPWDAEKCTIEASLTNAKGNVKLFYDHPDSKMSLIYFDDKEISTPKINGSTAAIIPFYYCGNSEDSDRLVSYIIIYNQKKYIYHLEYSCTAAQNCKPKVKLDIALNSLPSPLKTYLVTYLTAKHKAIKSFHQE